MFEYQLETHPLSAKQWAGQDPMPVNQSLVKDGWAVVYKDITFDNLNGSVQSSVCIIYRRNGS